MVGSLPMLDASSPASLRPTSLLRRGLFRATHSKTDRLNSVDHRVCVDRRFVFVHIPKTAGKSVRKAIYGKADGACHASLPVLLQQLPGERDDYFVFAFVRNPWDRLYSTYRYLSRGGNQQREDLHFANTELAACGDFRGFVMEWLRADRLEDYPHLIPQRRFLGPGDDFGVDLVGRFEQIEADFERIASQIGVAPTLGMENASPPADYRDAYDDDTRAKVGQLYLEDVEAFNYSF